MRITIALRLALPAAAAAASLLGACSSGSSSGPSPAVVRTATANDVTRVLTSMGISVKGAITCDGKAPGVIDCLGTTTDGKQISATLNASASGKTCVGPMVINLAGTQVANLPNEKCA